MRKLKTISQTSFLSEIISGEEIPVGKRAYFRERFRNNLYDMVVSEFQRQQQESGLTKAELTRRIGSRPEQVTRWLGAPGNWTLDTVSDLLLGLGCEPSVGRRQLGDVQNKNFSGSWWLDQNATKIEPRAEIRLDDGKRAVSGGNAIASTARTSTNAISSPAYDWATDERKRA